MIMSVTLPSRAGPPPVDAHLVAEDSGYEIIDGRLVPMPPAREPHGERHSKVNALLEAFVTAEYNVACDMLTRTSETSEVAPDASVYPIARDSTTGGRQLECLAFQVVATETLAHAATRAAALTGRGVRRVFAVDVDHKRALEWSAETASWQVLHDAFVIDDVAFVAPLPVEALVKAAKADDAVALALLAKRNPVLVAAEARARAEGRVEGARRSLFAILEARDLSATADVRRRIESCAEIDRLERWIARALKGTSMQDVFDE
jgi:hypothetical protein